MEQSTFSKMLDENLDTLNFKVGSLISGVIVDLTDDWVVVHVGLKSEPIIARNEFPVSYTHLTLPTTPYV